MKITPPSIQHLHHMETVNFDLFSSREEAEAKIYLSRSADACLLCAYRNVLLLYSEGCNFDYRFSLHRDTTMEAGEDRFFVVDILDLTILGGAAYLSTRIGRDITHSILLNEFKLDPITVLQFMNSCHFFTSVKEYTETRYWIYTDHLTVPFQGEMIKQYRVTLKHLIRNEYDIIIDDDNKDEFLKT